MKANTWVCGSCACIGIETLSVHKNAVDAMLTFCRQLGVKKVKQPFGVAEPDWPKAIESHVIFIAGSEVKQAYNKKTWYNYGTDFARFIRKNKLGKITTLRKIQNHKYHPKTTCQTWLWQPDLTALIGWVMQMQADKVVDENLMPLALPKDRDTCSNCHYPYSQHVKWVCPYNYGTQWS